MDPGERPASSERPDRSETAAIEAVLTVAVDPVPPGMLAELLELPVEAVENLCAALAASYETERRGFRLARVAGGYRLQSHEAYVGYVERFVLDGTSQKLSPAALETLAVVAYKQPVSRGQISAIRGVNADGVLRLLTARGYVEAVGRDVGPGQPLLFGTTRTFLERLGLDSLAELPPLEEFVPPVSTVEMLEQALRPDL
ncbi:MAG: SMC-Scp complex subunit ScpB [Acidimicrobiales bacterium]